MAEVCLEAWLAVQHLQEAQPKLLGFPPERFAGWFGEYSEQHSALAAPAINAGAAAAEATAAVAAAVTEVANAVAVTVALLETVAAAAVAVVVAATVYAAAVEAVEPAAGAEATAVAAATTAATDPAVYGPHQVRLARLTPRVLPAGKACWVAVEQDLPRNGP